MKKIAKSKIFGVLLFSALFIVGCSTAEKKPRESRNRQKNTDQPIAIQGAMDVEVAALLDEMKDYKVEKHGNYTFYVGKIGDIPVVVSKTEIGMVHAAASTTLLIEKYHPKTIINQGTAGGHDPHLHVFDTVIGTEVINIGNLRTEYLGEDQGMKPDTWIFMPTRMMENGEEKQYESFQSDPELVKIALSVADKYKYGKVVEGKVGSADFWNREIDRIHWFHEKAGTSVEEMEAASVAQVAKGYNIPYLAVRTVSNSEVSGDNIEDLETAGQYGAEFAVEIVKAIG
ncbi:5'-methylthioadenosine/S-adenosylhomocysteine nucleosidase [Sporosarcina sp. ANT_H38]|uniref:5'-methylthioadenosine/S-adenosylhomocysteine nucleosidase n=1 Tax=Sporosarcina sp. ANT_H38 TaxID=2597358 RepID=UPI0011F3F0F2|nr:5'-methylthioadenosine/S-adenosylhomocysteine nucleosidase [Sporosarcina sp. ANT_H38]KAA0942089.1 5'-methylthioadenosine/S-adenosylhomocysteine nucleosidase [Sporosarcina sp. ANT_H38]